MWKAQKTTNTGLAQGLAAAVVAMIVAFAPATALAEGDAEAGEKVFKKCKACHTIEQGAKNKIGPNLWGIADAEAGNKEFKYSPAFQEKVAEGLIWTDENLQAWLENPQKFIKKSKMVLKLRKQKDRDNLIAYLKAQ